MLCAPHYHVGNFDDVPDSVFTLPEAIKTLLAKKGRG